MTMTIEYCRWCVELGDICDECMYGIHMAEEAKLKPVSNEDVMVDEKGRLLVRDEP